MDYINVNLKENSYPIIFTNSFGNLTDIFSQNISSNKILIITDSNVDSLYSSQVIEMLQKKNTKIDKYVIEAGESSKNLKTINSIYSKCMHINFDRYSCIIALGGGVVGDIAGFAASTYMRGVQYVQIPTTLIAQVDSSIGGKTGVNFKGSKNIIGSFYQPKFVYINISTLSTLDKRQFLSGMAEVIKYAIIKDKELFNYLDKNANFILEQSNEHLLYIIKKCCKIKSEIVSFDEKEKNIRAILNFGHTIGHAVESASQYELLHGECVAFGMAIASKLSLKFNILGKNEYNKIISLIKKYDLLNVPKIPNIHNIMSYLEKDKKIKNSKITFILPRNIGQFEIKKNVNKTNIKDILIDITSK